ncbi:uncharacterized protein LOC105692415 [Athalia rosae]|uniref:uncharacterized protein LOC105692415 n=1 Tax=Athalia rosae TaxID=37344 RepID=UPI002033A8C8|nr:uncharacterized protein LOC105692415 [Athalia rosae]XP_048515595.1 uncharacterized protein LOC105692415 [Athalia rosae]XP_048515596.1 uncharacterized protein LOC105692415 [Athalia rosae]
MADEGVEVRECLSSWLAYLQTLNGLCTAGTKLAQSLQALLSTHEGEDAPAARCRLTGQCLAGWEELTRATNVASNTVKSHVSHVMASLTETQGAGTADSQDILCDNLLTFINLQYQFCLACCECLGGMAECSCSRNGRSECDVAALQRCFERLYSPSSGSSSGGQQHLQGQRSRLPYPLFPLQVQRRWSETAAAEVSGTAVENATRRWSMPWDCRHVSDFLETPPTTHHDHIRGKLKVPIPQERGRPVTPDNSSWKSSTMASQDGLREAIQLLSCRPGIRPSTQLYHPSQHIPGVTLTTCSFDRNSDGSGTAWPDTRSSSRCWPRDVNDHSDHSASEQSGTSGSGHRDSKDSIQSQSDHSGIGHRESDAGIGEILGSRKSSSSNDSCVSAQSRSGSEGAVIGGESARSQLYSMWSGGDLPFIKLPDASSEQSDKDAST